MQTTALFQKNISQLLLEVRAGSTVIKVLGVSYYSSWR